MDGLKEIQVVLPEVRVGILFDPHDDVRTTPFSVGEFSGREALVTQSFRFTLKVRFLCVIKLIHHIIYKENE